jgi:Arc/MetJ-type ribon-helix-helix transcriptional regulator
MTQVQVRIPEKLLDEIDAWVAEGRFKSRSDAIKTIVSFYEEREKTRAFLQMLNDRREDVEKKPEELVPLDDVA